MYKIVDGVGSVVNFNIIKSRGSLDIKAWNNGVHFESGVYDQSRDVAEIPGVVGISLMPDAHFGMGCTVGSVIATKGIIIPAAVGVDIGCGMDAVRTNLTIADLPKSLAYLREEIEAMIPVGFDYHSPKRLHDPRHVNTSIAVGKYYRELAAGSDSVFNKHPGVLDLGKNMYDKIRSQLGTLGGGNHFIELSLDENDDLWIVLHSGSRGIGNCTGRYFINLAKAECATNGVKLPSKNLAYFTEGSSGYDDYYEAVQWAQQYAFNNRAAMLELVIVGLARHFSTFDLADDVISCHHNFVQSEIHGGEKLNITRKGAVYAGEGVMGIIPGSMGAKSFIVRGLGNADSYESCSHGAGRAMSRTDAKKTFTVADHVAATAGIECRKDKGVLDETPGAYKSIDAVMAAQTDLVEPVHTLRQVVSVKG